MKGYSSVEPQPTIAFNGGWQHRYNIEQITRETDDGPVTEWQYDFVNVPKTLAVRQQAAAVIQDMLDKKAREYDYDSMNNATGWAGTMPDADALKLWGASCWQKSTEIEQQVAEGLRPQPTPAELIAEMPTFVEPPV